MSDIQDLIHKTTMDSIEKGQAIERERMIKAIEAAKIPNGINNTYHFNKGIDWALGIIKGEING